MEAAIKIEITNQNIASQFIGLISGVRGEMTGEISEYLRSKGNGVVGVDFSIEATSSITALEFLIASMSCLLCSKVKNEKAHSLCACLLFSGLWA